MSFPEFNLLSASLSLLAVTIVVLFALRDYARAKAKRVTLHVLPEPQNCETCLFWDRDLFAEQAAKHPAFHGAMQVVGPAEMIAGYTHDEHGERKGINIDDHEVRHATWRDAGVCKKHDWGCLKMDVCADWTSKRPKP